MDNLLPHYEYELGVMARGLAEFAMRNPKIAARLGIASGEVGEPHVARLIQTFAWLAAHITSKLADDYPEFTEALLEIVSPHYLRTVPSCAIVQFRPAGLFSQLTKPFVVPRGTTLDARAAPCRFQTAYDVTFAPLHIRSARLAPATIAPSNTRLPEDTTGIVSITFASASPSGQFDSALPDGNVRVHLAGEQQRIAMLLDTLLLRSTAAFVEADQSKRWSALSKVPFEAVGFGDHERLLPESPNGTTGTFRYLLEFFAFPALFDFIDIDLGRIRRAARAPEARQLTLHVAVRDTGAESEAAQQLASLDANVFRLFCTPVINLFPRAAKPILLTATDGAYPVTPDPLDKNSPLEIYSIDTVHLGARTVEPDRNRNGPPVIVAPIGPRTPISPYRAFGHGSSGSDGVYWVAFRDPDAALMGARGDLLLSLVGLDGASTRPKHAQANVVTRATNGELPARLPIGHATGDLLLQGLARTCPAVFLTKPTLPADVPRGNGALWRVLSTLSPHPIDLTKGGLSGLRSFLKLHAVRSASFAQACLDAMVDLDYKPAMKWMSLDGKFQSFVRGIEIRLTVDETLLREVSLHAFVRLMDRFFTRYGPENSYVQLVVCSAKDGRELIRGAAAPGTQPLI